MKQAYVSLVLQATSLPSSTVIQHIDRYLHSAARAHEIVMVLPSQHLQLEDDLAVFGPITVVMTHYRSTPDSSLIAGLGRAVGDFVIEWRGPLEDLDDQLLGRLLAPSDSGVELVEVLGQGSSLMSYGFTRFVNGLRPRETPIQRTVGRLFSRHAVQSILRATSFEPQVDVLVAELPVQRSRVQTATRVVQAQPWRRRLSNGWVLLAKGTRFGSTVPLTLAAVSALFGLAAAVYALALLLIWGQAPEGWTTLMVVIGLGQAAILTMLGLLWARIDALTRGLSGNHDATAYVAVVPAGTSPGESG